MKFLLCGKSEDDEVEATVAWLRAAVVVAAEWDRKSFEANFFPGPAAFPFATPISTPPFRFDVDGTNADTDLWMRVRFGGRAEMSLISGVSGVTANVTIRPPISGSSGLGVPLTPFFFLNPFEKWFRPFCKGEAGESIRKSGTGLEDPLAVPLPAAWLAKIAIGNADLKVTVK